MIIMIWLCTVQNPISRLKSGMFACRQKLLSFRWGFEQILGEKWSQKPHFGCFNPTAGGVPVAVLRHSAPTSRRLLFVPEKKDDTGVKWDIIIWYIEWEIYLHMSIYLSIDLTNLI